MPALASKSSVVYTPMVVSALTKRYAKAAWKQLDPTYLLSNNQADLVKGLERARLERVRHVVFRCSRRWGKSFTMVVYALKMCLQNPGFKVQYVAGTIKLVRRVVQPAFKDVMAQCPPEFQHLLPKWNGQLGQYEFDNGSVIVVGGADNNNIDDLLGQAANLIIIDEAGYIKVLEEAVNRVLGPMLATTKGTMIVASTPPADPTHYFHQLCTAANAKGYLFHRDVYTCDTGLVDPEYEKENAGGDGSDFWKREWLAIPTIDATMTVLPDFMGLKNKVVKEFVRPPYFDYYSRYITLDYGYDPDASGILFAYYDFQSATIYVEDELLLPKANSRELAEAMNTKKKALWGEMVVHKQVADGTNISLADMWDQHRLYFEMVSKGDGSVLANANNTNVMLRDKQLIIHPRCKNLIAQMEAAQWKSAKGTKREFTRSNLFYHFDLVASLFYLVRSVDYHYNPVPAHPGFVSGQHVARPVQAQPDDEVTENLRQVFGAMVPLGRD